MVHVSYTDLRQKLAHYMDEVISSRAPLLVTRQGGKGNVVILSQEEFDSWEETLHLFRSPANATRLLQSVRSADAGRSEERALVDPEP